MTPSCKSITADRKARLIVQSLAEVDRDDVSELTDSRLDLPRLKRRRRDFLTGSFLATLGEKQPAFPDSTLKATREAGHDGKWSF